MERGKQHIDSSIWAALLVLPVKDTTGDPGDWLTDPDEGQIYVNTFDNKVRVYADGAWRDLATW